MEQIITIEELTENFQKNKVMANTAWQTARNYRNCNTMHESGVSNFAFYLAEFYRIVFENETIAKILEHYGVPEYQKEVRSAKYNRELTT